MFLAFICLLPVIADGNTCRRGSTQDTGCVEEDVGSLLQHGAVTRLNVSGSFVPRRSRNVMLLQRSRGDKPEKSPTRPVAKHCGPLGVAAAACCNFVHSPFSVLTAAVLGHLYPPIFSPDSILRAGCHWIPRAGYSCLAVGCM